MLLGVLSERRMQVPRYGEVLAAPTFRMVAAMNPFDAVGTGRVTPALYDRTCRLAVGYQDETEEREIVSLRSDRSDRPRCAERCGAVRLTRDHSDLRIGSSVRGAIDTVAVAGELAALRRSEPDRHVSSDGASDGAPDDSSERQRRRRLSRRRHHRPVEVGSAPQRRCEPAPLKAVVEGDLAAGRGGALGARRSRIPPPGKAPGSDRHPAARATPVNR